ncbi:MAG TPA: helix-turn-helix domain-containing protein [Isosphaeraceae bacterium]|nr:helix-turn-helix domain-containing protein [Isosphaeraceae bacterium]
MASTPKDTLSPSWLAVLHALTRGPSAWVTPVDLALQLGEGESTVTDLLADLDVAGWICVWEREDGLAVMLTSWAAHQLGVRLEELGGGLQYRWVDAGNPEPSVFRARNVTRSDALENLDLVFDPHPTPDEALEALDFALWNLQDSAPRRDLDAGRVPAPTHLLGESTMPWPGPSESPGPCPICQERSLDPQEYCLLCDRWGLDDRFGLSSRPRPRRSSSTHDRRGQTWHSPQSLHRPHTDAQSLRAARKARRKQKHLARQSSVAIRRHP